MKTKKYISIALIILLMFSFCSFSSYAADGSGEISVTDFSLSATVTTDNSGTQSTQNVTNNLTVNSPSTGTFAGFQRYLFPANTSGVVRSNVTLTLTDKFELRSGHEYQLKFNWGYNISLPCKLSAKLYFYDSGGQALKVQEIVSSPGNGASKVQYVSLNFTPDVEDFEAGYKCNLIIEFYQDGYQSASSQQAFLISKTITLTDLDDDSGFFNSIIDAIKAIPERIKGFFTDLANNIGNFFTELANSIKGFFDTLKNYILYFQDPVTLNKDGVLVDEKGQPIYTNPFENSIEDIQNTFNGWIDNIRQFISSMDESRAEVSGYLQTGTGLINDVLAASPVVSVCLIFVAAFFVIRKVVGR